MSGKQTLKSMTGKQTLPLPDAKRRKRQAIV
jgi:hypothetical protein